MKNKNILFASLLSFLPITVFAGKGSDFTVKIGGSVDAQYGIINQEDAFKKDKSGKKYNQNGLTNSNSLKFNIDKKNDNGSSYGAFIKLNADVEKDKEIKGAAKEAKVYFKGNFGKVELGSTSPVGNAMEVNSYSIARATGGLDGDWDDWLKNGAVISGSKNYKDGYLTAPQLPIGFDDESKANKISYFSPNISGVSFGVSYAPSSKGKGTTKQVRELFKDYGGGYRNVWQPAVRYEKAFDGGIKFATAVLGEFAEAKDYSWDAEKGEEGKPAENIKRKNLAAWQVGASVEYNGFAVAGSYGDFGKSGTRKEGREADKKYGAKYWSLGSAYSTGQYGISINYMQSKRAGFIFGKDKDTAETSAKSTSEYNKFEAISVGADYQVMPGFMPYVEVTRFKFKENKSFAVPNASNLKFNKGTVFLAGTKVKF